MALVLGVATQEPAFVGWVAVLSVLIVVGVAYLVLVVSVGGEGVSLRPATDEFAVAEPVPAPTVAALPPVIIPVGARPPETFADSMATSLRGIAASVVERAGLRLGDRILDAGSGLVMVASAGLVAGRTVPQVDPAAGTLAIGRRLTRGARVAGADFAPLEFARGWFNVVIAVHLLQFAADPVGVLAEWRRVTGPGGRLSISVPGPRPALAMTRLDPIYRRHDAGLQVHLPTRATLTRWAEKAGWREPKVVADSRLVLRLTGRDAFHTWMETRPWSDPDQGLSPAQSEALERDLLAVIPTGPDGHLQIPFGALYMTARNQ